MDANTDVTQLLRVVSRRKYQFILPGLVVFFFITAIAFVLPSVYRSEATILIEDQNIPQDLVRTSVTGFVEERLQSITQVVLSHGNMLKIINEFDLYPDERDKYTTEELIQKMRDEIEVEPITTDVSSMHTGRAATATVAFVLAFEDQDPLKANQVANMLTTLFLQENLKSREEKARSTFEFLEVQLAELRSEIGGIEERIARFKEEHVNELPELMVHNMNTMERLQREMDTAHERINTLINRKIYLEGQLATVPQKMGVIRTDGRRMETSQDDLDKLRREYLALRARLSEKHPDVISMRKQMESFERELGLQDDLTSLSMEIDAQEAALASLRRRYTDKHPDVRAAAKALEEMKSRFEEKSKRDQVLKKADTTPDNPAWVNLKTQITSTRMEIKAMENEYKSLKDKYEVYQRRVERTPAVEQEYRAYLRDYDNAQAKYKETSDRLLAAKEAKGLEQSQLAERFTLVDPPSIPEKPVRPNRMALVLVGFVLSLGVGIGAGSLAEFMDRSVNTPEELTRLTALPVLVEIPYWQTAREAAGIKRKKILAALLWLLIFLGALAAVHFLYMPLDVLALKIFRKIMLNF